jgi:hypothetical protein
MMNKDMPHHPAIIEGRNIVEGRTIVTAETTERPPDQRPVRDTVKSIADWLIGDARQIESGVEAVDEYAWRLYAASIPVLRVSLHVGTLHPQFLGAALIWWRDTGQTSRVVIKHEIADLIRTRSIQCGGYARGARHCGGIWTGPGAIRFRRAARAQRARRYRLSRAACRRCLRTIVLHGDLRR